MKKLLTLLFVCTLSLPLLAQTYHTVNSGNFYYTPEVLTITVGDTVEWLNDGGFHDVNGTTNTLTGMPYNNPESFGSVATAGSSLLIYEFTVAGTYEYDCSVGQHAANGMTGTLIVNPADTSDTNTSVIEINGGNTIDFTATYVPSEEGLYIQFDVKQPVNKTTVSIHNIAGKLLKEAHIKAHGGTNNHLIPLNGNVPAGIYFVTLSIDSVVATNKVVVQ